MEVCVHTLSHALNWVERYNGPCRGRPRRQKKAEWVTKKSGFFVCVVEMEHLLRANVDKHFSFWSGIEIYANFDWILQEIFGISGQLWQQDFSKTVSDFQLLLLFLYRFEKRTASHWNRSLFGIQFEDLLDFCSTRSLLITHKVKKKPHNHLGVIDISTNSVLNTWPRCDPPESMKQKTSPKHRVSVHGLLGC